MKFATMACTTLVGLFVCLGAVAPPAKAQQPPQQHSQPAAPANPAAKAPAAPATPSQAAPNQPSQNQTAAPSVGRHGAQTRSGDRRRRTYASCNRLSHARGLRGGVRRRFLIRCKLGYERPKPVQNQAPQAAPPSQGRQP